MTTTSAPGKVLLAGEYAVLEGFPAVVAAVNRRARARLGKKAVALSPFLEALRADAPAVARVVVDTSALYDAGGRKLGLGSSAATVVAAAACAMHTRDRRLIHTIAHVAHARAQEPRGSRGSGADVAASVYGGVIRVTRREGTPPEVSPVEWPKGLAMVLVSAGAPADTPALVARVRAWRERDPDGHAFAMSSLGECAARFLEDPIGATRTGADLLASMGKASGAPLVPESFAPLAAHAKAAGGAAKPTGAGGGDLVLSLFSSDGAAQSFRERIQPLGMTVVECSVDPLGVELAEGDDSE